MIYRAPLTAFVAFYVLLTTSSAVCAQKGGTAAQNGSDISDAETKPVIELYDRLFFAKNRVDFTRDGLVDVLEKRRDLEQLLARHAQELQAHLVESRWLAPHYVLIRNAASPRLSGRVVRVGPRGDYDDLKTAWPKIQPGDLVLLEEGRFSLGEERDQRPSGLLKDIAIVGAGPAKTALQIKIAAAQRLRLEGLRIDCEDDPLLELRNFGAAHLRDCRISGYNSGAGGSNAIYASGGILLVERCVFEGLSGRAVSRGSGGNAFDLRGRNFLYVRQSNFVNNQEIIRATFPCVFDRCSSSNATQWDQGIIPYPSGFVLLRDNHATIKNRDNTTKFAYATDDPALVEFLTGQRAEIDEEARALADKLALRRSLPYWIGLLRQDESNVRALAAGRLKELIDEPVTAAAGSDGGPLDGQGPLFQAEREYARLMEWYEKNKDVLTWDETAQRYKIRP